MWRKMIARTTSFLMMILPLLPLPPLPNLIGLVLHAQAVTGPTDNRPGLDLSGGYRLEFVR